jgi:hypothetical protein
VVLAEWLTAPENPYFATNVANRVWAHFFGRGIVEPVDDIRASNPPSNPELFEELGRKLVEYRYDFKQLVRDICNSETYQRSFIRNETNEHDERNFAHAGVRRIPAEQLLDCLNQVTETQEKVPRSAAGSTSGANRGWNDQQLFPDLVRTSASRDGVCLRGHDCPFAVSSVAPAERRRRPWEDPSAAVVVKKLLDEGKTPEQIIETLFIRSLTRRPTADEVEQLTALAAQAANPQIGLEDVMWAILNSREFLFNH